MARLTKSDIFYGKEPVWVDGSNYDNFMNHSLYWYSCTSEHLKKKWLIEHFGDNVKVIPDAFVSTIGSLARLLLKGVPLKEKHIKYLNTKTLELVKRFNIPKEETTDKKLKKIDINDKKVGDVLQSYDDIIDDIIDGKRTWTIKTFSGLSGPNINEIRSYYQRQLEYIKEDKDEYTLAIYKRLVKIHEEIIAKYVVVRKPRKKKSISKDKIVSKVKYLKSSSEYNIKSHDPTHILGAMRVYLFNTKTRKLIVYVAKDDSGLGIKGTTITGFSDKSNMKTIRKPLDILPIFSGKAYKRMETVYNDINAVEKNVTGRINNDIVIVNVVK